MLRLENFRLNWTNAISSPLRSSMKQHSASRTDCESLEYISQSTFRIILPPLISEDTLSCKIHAIHDDDDDDDMMDRHLPSSSSLRPWSCGGIVASSRAPRRRESEVGCLPRRLQLGLSRQSESELWKDDRENSFPEAIPRTPCALCGFPPAISPFA